MDLLGVIDPLIAPHVGQKASATLLDLLAGGDAGLGNLGFRDLLGVADSDVRKVRFAMAHS